MPDTQDESSLYDKLTALETRLRESIESKFREVKDMFAVQQSRQDEMIRTLATRGELNEVRTLVAKLDVLLHDHLQGPGHHATLTRIDDVEEDIADLKGRPLKTWQIVATAILGVLAVGGFILNFLSYLHTVGHP